MEEKRHPGTGGDQDLVAAQVGPQLGLRGAGCLWPLGTRPHPVVQNPQSGGGSRAIASHPDCEDRALGFVVCLGVQNLLTQCPYTAEGTPYAGGLFRMKLLLGKDFPASPPKGYFLTKIFHPNVGANGEICVNVLKRDWTAELGIRHVLLVSSGEGPGLDSPVISEPQCIVSFF